MFFSFAPLIKSAHTDGGKFFNAINFFFELILILNNNNKMIFLAMIKMDKPFSRLGTFLLVRVIRIEDSSVVALPPSLIPC